MTMLLSLLLLMFSALPWLFCCCCCPCVVAGIHLVASFPALTAIPAVADDQCHAVAGFPVVAVVLLLLSTMLLMVSLLLLAKLLLLASCCGFLAVACIHDGNGITDISCCCFGVRLLLASMLLWHTLLLLVYRTYHNVAYTLAVPPFTGILAIAV
jgi:hypothetical protein